MKPIALIVASSFGGIIGKDNNLPWPRIKIDMDFFVEKTIGNPVVMGRKNYESIPEKYRPLKNRTNIVLTRDRFWQPKTSLTVCVANDFWQALSFAERADGEKIFIIGGAEVYKLAIDNVIIKEVFLTEIQHSYEGNVYFPHFNEYQYTLQARSDYAAGEKTPVPLCFKHFVLK